MHESWNDCKNVDLQVWTQRCCQSKSHQWSNGFNASDASFFVFPNWWPVKVGQKKWSLATVFFGMRVTVKWVYGVRMCPRPLDRSSLALLLGIPEAFDLSFVCSSVWDKKLPVELGCSFLFLTLMIFLNVLVYSTVFSEINFWLYFLNPYPTEKSSVRAVEVVRWQIGRGKSTLTWLD